MDVSGEPGDPRIFETPLATHCCSQRPNHSAMTHPSKTDRHQWHQLHVGHNSESIDSCDQPCNLAQIRSKLIFDKWLRNTIGNLLNASRSYVWHFIAIHEFKLQLPAADAPIRTRNRDFRPLWPWNWTDDLENNMAPILCHLWLCA